MPQNRELNGTELEEWFKNVAKRTEILDTQSFKLEDVVRLFDRHLQKRFEDARPHIKLEFPYGNDWIDTILQGRSLPQVDEQIKQQLACKLMDLTLATDLVVKIKTVAGAEVRIAVDVTWNNSRKSEKIGKVRGLPQKKKDTVNQNENVPVIRKRLGITKHLVVVLSNQTDKLPSDEKLLSEIKNFAEAMALTQAINLRNLPANERFDWEGYACDPQKLWDECSPGIKERTAIETSVKIAAKAMRKGHSPETVAQMMVHDPEYRRLLKLNQGVLTSSEAYAKFIAAKASDLINRDLASPKTQHDLNLRGLKAVRAIVSPVGKDEDGSQVFESNDYRLKQRGTAFSLGDTIGQRGTILEFSQGVLDGSIAVADIRNLERLAQAQQQREGAETQQQQVQDRAEYVAIAQQVREELGNVSAERVDIEVYLRTGKNGDRVLSQSDHVQTLGNPNQAKQYTESVRAKASQYQEDQALYKKFASGIQKGQGTLIPYRVDLEIQFHARLGKHQDPERLLTHSDVAKAFYKEDPIKAQRYIKAIGELGTLYEGLRESPNQDAVNQSIPKLVQKKLTDPAALQQLRQEALCRQQARGTDGLRL